MTKQFSMLDGNDVMELTEWCKRHYPEYFDKKTGEQLYKVDAGNGTMEGTREDTYGVLTSR